MRSLDRKQRKQDIKNIYNQYNHLISGYFEDTLQTVKVFEYLEIQPEEEDPQKE